MKIEYVAGVSLTSGRTLEEQRKCSVSHSVLGQVIIYYECVLALFHEVFTHGASRIGSDVL